MSAKKVTIYTDGACSGNPGPGGWAAALIHGESVREISGGESETTNNRMELIAAIEALKALKQRCDVTLYTDSVYLRNGIEQWIHNWKRNGWKTADKKPVKNEDLWHQLDEQSARHNITWEWVKGHAGNHYNERVDQLATAEIENHRQTSANPRR